MSALDIFLFAVIIIIIAGLIMCIFLLGDKPHFDNKVRDILFQNDIEEQKIPRKSILYRFSKRCCDILIGLLCLMSFCPILLTMMIIIKRDDKGTVFETKECIGYRGKRVRYTKLRTLKMKYINGENPSSTDWVSTKEEIQKRYTTIGYFLHKTGMNNIPLFFSVLKGDLTIIGLMRIPFERVSESHKILFNYEKPGMINLNSIFSSLETSAETVDRMYLKSRSFGMDFKIIAYVIRHEIIG